ncbi:hypothetical protein T11_9238 [Trichinella zimbabwensis]|uniref:Uncharacterized protein n=1 Tax=Trichinella zimbabwensis TaxID=268475 RepID=A0A0V1GZ67_9BILA|nr:hypothetical protein T11_9238 [Trichinella zimbabwensis]
MGAIGKSRHALPKEEEEEEEEELEEEEEAEAEEEEEEEEERIEARLLPITCQDN